MKVVLRETKLGGVGLSPGQVVKVEEGYQGPSRMRVVSYGPDMYEEFETLDVKQALGKIGTNDITWIQVYGISHSATIKQIGRVLSIHPLAMEDIVSTWGRSKFQDYRDQIFVVGKAAILDEPNDRLAFEQVSIVVGRNYLISFQESENVIFAPVEERLRDPQRIIRKRESGYLLYALLDTLVDHLLASMGGVEEDITEMEDQMLENEAAPDLEAIYRLKRCVLMLSRMASPMQEMAKRLEILDSDIVPESLDYYFRDLADHCTRAGERITNARLVLQNLQDYYIMEGDHRTNEVMRVFTVIGTIFLPLSFIASIYGMNFNTDSPMGMPELDWPYAYPVLIGLMFIYFIASLIFFKKKGWLSSKK